MPIVAPEQQPSAGLRYAHAVVARMDRFAAWPVAVLFLTVVFLPFFDRGASFEHPWLLLSLNFLFATLLALAAAFWIGRSYLANGQTGLLLLGCGALTWGLSGFVAAASAMWPSQSSVFNANVLVTVHNTSAWLSAMCHLTGAAFTFAPYGPSRVPRHWLIIAYLSVTLIVAAVTVAVFMQWTPLFFLAGKGGSLTRQVVLGSAIAMFLLAATLFQMITSRKAVPFYHWYSLALILFAIGLIAVLMQKANGGLIGWVGRGIQYLGGVYLLAAVFRPHQVSLPEVISPERAAGGAAQRFAIALAVAVASTATAVAVRLFFLPHLGTNLTYLTFFPAVILAAFLGGYRSGLITTFLSIPLALFFWNEPVGRIVYRDLASLLDDLVFLVCGLLVTLAARATHHAQWRAFKAEAEVERLHEREQLTGLLREKEERLANIIDGTRAGTWDWNVLTGEVVFNERWTEMVGYTLAELAPLSIETWGRLTHPDDLRRAEEQLAEVCAGLRPLYDAEIRMRHRDGHWVWIHDRGKVVEWTAEGAARRMTGSHTDITERKKAEERLQAVTKELRVIVDTVPTGIVKVVDRQLVWTNGAMEAMLHYPKEELLFQSTKKLYPSEEAYHTLGQEAYPCLAQGGTYVSEQRLARKDGALLLSRFKGCAIDPADPSLGSIWAVEDITEQKRAEQAVLERFELFEALFVHSQMAQLLVDPRDGMIIDANGAAIMLYGYPLERLQSLGFEDIAVLEPVKHHRVIQRIMEEWTSPLDMRHRLASGEIRDMEVFSTLISIGGRTLIHVMMHDVSIKKQMAAKLRLQENNFRNLVETTTDLIVVAALDGTILFTNQHFRKRLGYSDDDLAAIHMLDLHPKAMRPEAEMIVAAMLRNERDICPLPVLTKTGELVPVETRAWIGAWDGRECIYGFLKDLSAEQEAQQRFERLFQHNPAPMALSSLPGRRLLDVNEAFVTVIGYQRDEVIGKTPKELGLFRTQPARVEGLIRLAMRQGRFAHVELRATGKDGQPIDGLFSGEVIDNQGAQYLLTVMIDITDRKRMEDALRQRDATLTSIIENQPGLVWLKDRNSRFLAANTLFANAFGRNRPDEVVGLTDHDFYPSELADASLSDDQRVMQSVKPLTVEETINVQGVPRWFEIFKTPLVDHHGKVTGTSGFALDITDRKEAEIALQRAKDDALAAAVAKNELLAKVAHEFRTPLSLLQTSLDILDEYGQRLSKKKRTEQNQHIRNATRQLIGLSNTILTYQRMDSGGKQNIVGPCNIDELCRDIAKETRAAWGKEHSFEMALTVDQKFLLVDAALFRHVLENLLVNAFKYTPTGRSVSLDVRRDNDWLRVTVADEGIGVEVEDQAHVFEPYFRGRNAGQRRGMGLGLHIVHEGMRKMGGTIALTSTVGEGTTMVVTLPWREVEKE